MGKYLKTRISEAFWFDPSSTDEGDWIKPARIPSMMEEPSSQDTAEGREQSISWLDCLFHGGVFLPESKLEDPRAITILITGPPGAGKSSLATELCYRWCINEKWSSLYITSESHQPWMIEKAKSFGWKKAAEAFEANEKSEAAVRVVPIEKFFHLESWITADQKKVKPTKKTLEELRRVFFPEPVPDASGTGNTKKLLDELPEMDTVDAKILVLDSLNTVYGEERRIELFKNFMNLASSGPQILMVILDSTPSGEAAKFWEFISDIVVRLGRNYDLGYMVRTLEIVKARYQPHVWGVHQLKIYEPARFARENNEPQEKYKSRLSRAHPYRREGGIFIFPSIHYVLSAYKRRHLIEGGNISTGVPGLEQLLPKGYPKSRCTALLGDRGGHKSHLSYLELLYRIIEQPASEQVEQSEQSSPERSQVNYPPEHKGLIISLRDDEGTTRATMQKILRQQWGEGIDLQKFEEDGHLEIMYFPPGNITPEEFFHRVLLSIQRLKQGSDHTHITLLFNSLDQLSSRFPLCAKQGIFILGIIQMLSAEGVSSFFVAAREPGQKTGEYYGVESMAELILNFEREPFEKKDYCQSAMAHFENLQRKGLIGKDWSPEDREAAENKVQDKRFAVVTEVVRFAGGQAAGAKGILELIDDDDPLCPLYGNKPGMHFLPNRTEKNADADD